MAYALKQSFKSGCLSWVHVRVLYRAFEVTAAPHTCCCCCCCCAQQSPPPALKRASSSGPCALPSAPSPPRADSQGPPLLLAPVPPHTQNTVFPGLIPTYFFLACGLMGPILYLTAPEGGAHELWDSLFKTALMGNLLAVNQVLMYLVFKRLRDLFRKELYSLPVQVRPKPGKSHLSPSPIPPFLRSRHLSRCLSCDRGLQAMRLIDLVRDVFWMAMAAFVMMYIPHFVAVTRAVIPCIKKRYVRGDKAVSSSSGASPSKDKPEENKNTQ